MFFREIFFLEQLLTSNKDSSFSGMQLVQSHRNWLFEPTERLTASLPNLLEPIAVYLVFVYSLQGSILQ
jgi:predicted double-glycine peptidase